MDCPNCKNHLKHKEVISKPYSIYVSECIVCGGWWFDGNNLEEYRASVLPTSKYIALPEFRLTSNQSPDQCCYCEQNSLSQYRLGLHIIKRCSECSGIFLSKDQLLEVVKIEEDKVSDIISDIGITALIGGIFGG